MNPNEARNQVSIVRGAEVDFDALEADDESEEEQVDRRRSAANDPNHPVHRLARADWSFHSITQTKLDEFSASNFPDALARAHEYNESRDPYPSYQSDAGQHEPVEPPETSNGGVPA